MVKALRTATITLLAGWCVIGVLETARGLSADTQSPSDLSGEHPAWVGMDLGGGPEVVSIRTLLRAEEVAEDSSAPAAVVVSRRVDPQAVLYLDYQLAHLEYPRLVDVVAADSVTSEQVDDHEVIVAASETPLPDGWSARDSEGPFILYDREAE